jgi:hypothetical protein
MRLPPTARWIALAILGMLIAAAVSIAASRVASQQIGLASEPISAGDALAPRPREKERGAPATVRPRVTPKNAEENGTTSTPPSSHPAPPAVSPATELIPAAPADDSSGSAGGDGEHGGGGADD